jgi:cyclic-di-GMP phosphodiesterase TipF (flagellum assembly factor)
LIAERIETEAVVVDILDYDVRFGQGFLFSPPRPMRAEGQGAAEPVAAAATPVAPAAAPAEAKSRAKSPEAPAPRVAPPPATVLAQIAQEMARRA